MTNKTNMLTKWQWDRKIPIGLVVAMILQTLTAIWWAAKLDTRVVMQEEWFQKNQHLAEKVFRLEERLIAIHEEINELEARFNHVK
ncbi:hypothetical protein [Acinetobacter sp.]|uniref:hypothetical protein n=1 Tax=Acinetobacter sp. TaxID=472 RepID=UPI0025C6B3D4|nr:hypothetical protein [Acinetobacter sp.]